MRRGVGLRRARRRDGFFEPMLDPREPDSSCPCACPAPRNRDGKAWRQAQGAHLVQGFRGLAAHGEVDLSAEAFHVEHFSKSGASAIGILLQQLVLQSFW